ncbi:hypothetical protein LBMAG42_44170 [Deltaproteobacteria bacterium]|nr:hypothetical protein LBMAG42_44170 [Deltaproteobacteria bacterium]
MSEDRLRFIAANGAPTIAVAVAAVLSAGTPLDRHDRLLALLDALVRLLAAYAGAAYVEARAEAGPSEDVERVIEEVHGKPNRSLGDWSRAATACWKGSMGRGPLAVVSLAKNRNRAAAADFGAAWRAVKELWKDHPTPDENAGLNYAKLVPKTTKPEAGDTSVESYLSALVNCRNAKAHADDWEISGIKVKLSLGERYFNFINPLVEACLLEVIEEVAASVGDPREARVESVLTEHRGPIARVRIALGQTAAVRDLPNPAGQLAPGDRWLIGADGELRWKLSDDLPAGEERAPEAGSAPAPAAAAPKQPGEGRVVFNVPFASKAETFVGRGEVLERVHALLLAGTRTVVGQTANIYGLGGVGKTQLAVEYAHRHRGDYPDGVMWISANEELPAQLAAMAVSQLGYPPDDKQENLVGLARQWLNTHRQYLLILDNLDPGQEVEPLLPRDVQPRILITSRHELPAPYAAVELDELDPAAALELLCQMSGLPGDDTLVALCLQLCHYPLAIELAGAYLKRHARVTTPAQYLDLVKARGLEARGLWGDEKTPGTKHLANVAATLSLDRAALKGAPEAIRLIEILAIWANRSTSLELLGAMAGIEDVEETRHFVGEAGVFCLLKIGQDQRVHLHPFLKEVVAKDLAGRAEARRELLSRMVEGALGWMVERKDETRQQEAAGELEGLRGLAQAYRAQDDAGNWFALFREIARQILRSGAHREVLEEWAQPALDEAVDRSAAVLDVTDCQLVVAHGQLDSGRFSDALAMANAATAARESAGVSELDVAEALEVVARCHQQRGEAELALNAALRVLQARELGLGNTDARTAAALQDVGVCIDQLGRPGESMRYFEQALNVCSVSGNEASVLAARILANYAGVLQGVGRTVESRVAAERAVATYADTVGLQHPEAALGLRALARALAASGDVDRALSAARSAVAVIEGALGASHFMLGENLGQLGIELLNSGDAFGAIQPLSRAVGLLASVQGSRYAGAPSVCRALAEAYSTLGRHNMALEYAERAVSMSTTMLGARAVETLGSREGLAIILHRLNRHEEARRILFQIWVIGREVEGPNHRNTRRSADAFEAVSKALNKSRPGKRQVHTKPADELAERAKKK